MIPFLQRIVNYIIRPTRDNYHLNRLGPKNVQIRSVLTGNLNSIHREDQSIQSHQEHNSIQLSYFKNQGANPRNCVIYLHANNGSRVEGLPYLKSLLENDFNVCFFDFLGSGLSDGQYITLGINQSICLQYVFKHLVQSKGIQNCVLWGRSMGAVTALIYTNRFPKGIAGIILDSPFKDMRKLIKQLAADRTGLPKFLFDPVITYLDLNVRAKTGMSIQDLKVKNHMQNSAFKQIPALFLVSKNDKLVKSHHGEKIFSRYLSDDKVMKYIDIQHHENRQANIIGICKNFILRVFEKAEQKKLSINQKFRANNKHKIHLKSKRLPLMEMQNQHFQQTILSGFNNQNSIKNRQLYQQFIPINKNDEANSYYFSNPSKIHNFPIISPQKSSLLREYYSSNPQTHNYGQPNRPKMLTWQSLEQNNTVPVFYQSRQRLSKRNQTERRKATQQTIINPQNSNYFQSQIINQNQIQVKDVRLFKPQMQQKRNSKHDKISLSNNTRMHSLSSPNGNFRSF